MTALDFIYIIILHVLAGSIITMYIIGYLIDWNRVLRKPLLAIIFADGFVAIASIIANWFMSDYFPYEMQIVFCVCAMIVTTVLFVVTPMIVNGLLRANS